MAQIKSSSAPGVEKAIVLFGLGDDGKPQAGLFAATEAALARKAAKELRLTIVDVSKTDLASRGLKVPAGKLYANRRSFIPNVRKDLHQKLLEFAKGGSAGSQSDRQSEAPPAPPSAGIPKDWDSIGVGHQVIVQSSVADGWWECITTRRENDVLTVRFRDFPKEPPFTVHVSQVALQQAHMKT